MQRQVRGDASIPATVPVRRRSHDQGSSQVYSVAGPEEGRASVAQSHWGIRPYSAFFGALKPSDEVKIDFDVALTPHT
jgi:hypothetical protein